MGKDNIIGLLLTIESNLIKKHKATIVEHETYEEDDEAITSIMKIDGKNYGIRIQNKEGLQ